MFNIARNIAGNIAGNIARNIAGNIAGNIARNIARCGCLYFPQFSNVLLETCSVWMGQQGVDAP